jgi:hypothetical protein
VYDTDTGRLYYDADGSGSEEAQLLATLALAPGQTTIAASDITVA